MKKTVLICALVFFAVTLFSCWRPIFNEKLSRELLYPVMVTTIAGDGISGFIDHSNGLLAEFSSIEGLALDSSGNLFVADSGNCRVRMVANNGTVSTFAGSGPGIDLEGTLLSAVFNNPSGLAFNDSGDLYLSAFGSFRILKIFKNVDYVNFYAGTGANGSADGLLLTIATFQEPHSLAINGSGEIFVTDPTTNRIRFISATNVTTLAPPFNQPHGIVLDTAGNLYVADTSNNRICKLVPPYTVVTSFAGTMGVPGYQDGTGSSARFNQPWGLAIDGKGNLYVTDRQNHSIRKITPEGRVSTVAGTGLSGSQDGLAKDATFNFPLGIAVNDSGSVIYVADAGNFRIRKISF